VMATIFLSSDTASLSSVIISCTISATLNTPSRDNVVTLGAWTNWPDSCGFWVKSGAGISAGLVCSCWGCCSCCRLPRSTVAKDFLGIFRFEENALPSASLGADRRLLLCSGSSLAWLQSLYLDGCGCCPSFSLQLQQLGWSFPSDFQGTACKGGRLRTTNIVVAADSLSKRGQIFGSYNTVLSHSEPCIFPPSLQCDRCL
jgi:hypothetical protein